MTILSKHWYAVIPARAGSKSIKNKNLLPTEVYRLYDIQLSLQKIEQISNVFVTTDSEDIINIANSLGAVAVHRPKYPSGDDSEIMNIYTTWESTCQL